MPEERLRALNGMGCLERVGSGEIPPRRHARTPAPRYERTVEAGPVKVLLVGGSSVGFSPLSEQLQKSGYQCQFVSTCLDGARLIARASFDLVLCSGRMKGFQLLLSAVRRSSGSLFRYLLVEDGCWWVPTVLCGESCSRAPAFRGAEFADALDTMTKEVRFVSRIEKVAAGVNGRPEQEGGEPLIGADGSRLN
jgi:hypothetical protein